MKHTFYLFSVHSNAMQENTNKREKQIKSRVFLMGAFSINPTKIKKHPNNPTLFNLVILTPNI